MKLSFSFAAWVKVASLSGKVFATSVIARGEPPRALRTTREKGIVVESRSVKETDPSAIFSLSTAPSLIFALATALRLILRVVIALALILAVVTAFAFSCEGPTLFFATLAA